MMDLSLSRVRLTKLGLVVTCMAVVVAAIAQSDNPRGGRRINSGGPKPFQSSCGNSEQVSKRIGECVAPLFDMVEGRIPIPKGDADLLGCCDRFSSTEKCVRNTGRDCLGGLHKTAVSAVASASKRFHKQECKSPASRAKYSDPLICSVKKAKELTAMYKNMTSIAQAVRDSPNISPEEKLLRMCCLFNQLDKEIDNTLKSECPKSVPLILGIVHGMMDDARNTLCVNPKCGGVLEPIVSKARYKQNQNFFEPTMQVLFMLGTE